MLSCMGISRGLRSFLRLFVLAVALGGLAAGAKCSAPAQAGPLDALDSLHFVLRYRTAGFTGPACGVDHYKNGTIGVPMSLDMGGSALPDLLVEVAAVPGVGGQPSRLQLNVTELRTEPLKSLIEVVLNPSADASRVAFGYDGCDTGAPQSFSASVTSSATQLTLDTSVNQPRANLTLLGSAFTQGSGTARLDPTALEAGLSPVPQKLSAVVNILGGGAYTAVVTPSAPTDVTVDFLDQKGAASLELVGALTRLPGRLDLAFSSKKVDYKTVAPFQTVSFTLDQTTPATATKPLVVDHLNADLQTVPAAATVIRNGTKITFDTPGAIGSTLVHYSSANSGATPGALTLPGTAQYVSGNVGIDSMNAQAVILGLSHAEIDTGDPVIADVTHTAGPLGLDVTQRTPAPECDQCPSSAPPIVRHLTGKVTDMPATARVTYSPATGDYSYSGSSVISDLTADVTSSVALVDEAKASHLHLTSFPTGLTGRIDTTAKTFSANLTGGTIGAAEARVTSGPQDALPAGVDGVLLHDHDGSYVAFVRVSGLSSALVGWGDTQFATVTHAAGPFLMQVDADDPDAGRAGIHVDGAITNLPGVAHVEYTPARKRRLFPFVPARPSKFVYTGSELIGQVRFDVTSDEAFNASGVDTLHILAKRVPGLTLIQDDVAGKTTATTDDGTNIGYLHVEACAAVGCQTTIPAHGDLSTVGDPDLVTVSDRSDGKYDVFALVRGLSSLEATVVKTSTGELDTATLSLTHQPGPLEVHTAADKVNVVTLPDLGLPGIDPITVEVPYVETADVVAHNLPGHVKFSYSGLQQHLNYTEASGPIGSLDINYSKGVVPVAARAHNLHVNLAGLQPGVDLTYNFGDAGDSLLLDTGGAKIGHVAFDLVGDMSLLSKPSVASDRILNEGYDGLLFMDLTDTVAGGDATTDPYLLLARATNLSHLDYKAESITWAGSDNVSNHQVEITRLGGGPDIAVHLYGNNNGKSAQTLAGFPNPFKYDYVGVAYYGPPDTLGFSFKHRTDDGPKQFWIDAWGSSTGQRVDLHTNAGTLTDLFAHVYPVPAGTATSPGLSSCIAPASMYCGQKNLPDFGSGQFSLKVNVREPVHVYVDQLGSGGGETVADINIERLLEFSKEVNHDGANSTAVFLDTNGATLDGHVTIYDDDGDVDTQITAPINTRALDRYVEVENAGVNESRNRGMLLCPYGFSATTTALGFTLSLNDDLCSTSILTGPSNTVVSADGQPHTVDLFGWGMVDATFDGTSWHDGTRVFLTDSDGSSFMLSNPVWISPYHIQVPVPAGLAEGDYTFSLKNPTDESRKSQDTPASRTCILTVASVS